MLLHNHKRRKRDSSVSEMASYDAVPYRVRLQILSWISVSVPEINRGMVRSHIMERFFFGYFPPDVTRTIFPVFRCVKARIPEYSLVQLRFPLNLLSIEFCLIYSVDEQKFLQFRTHFERILSLKVQCCGWVLHYPGLDFRELTYLDYHSTRDDVQLCANFPRLSHLRLDCFCNIDFSRMPLLQCIKISGNVLGSQEQWEYLAGRSPPIDLIDINVLSSSLKSVVGILFSVCKTLRLRFQEDRNTLADSQSAWPSELDTSVHSVRVQKVIVEVEDCTNKGELTREDVCPYRWVYCVCQRCPLLRVCDDSSFDSPRVETNHGEEIYEIQNAVIRWIFQ